MQADFLDINLLPRDRRRVSIAPPLGRRFPELLGLAMLLFALLTLVPLGVIKIRNDRQLARTQAAVMLSREQVRATDQALVRESQLRQQIQTMLIQADTLEQQVRQLEEQGGPISLLLQPMTEALPPRVIITSVIPGAGSTVRVVGTGGSTPLVLEFAQALERVPDVRKVTIVSIDRRSDASAAPTAVVYTLEVER
ncbi:MAG: PilN domain-containing protein [Ardenticatenaceae bacterium]|nr:PilN domain-containing protein [Ardenticatenaceae bacterium]HBY97037.1 hypothetical protein [Chloroflexota bacterium]